MRNREWTGIMKKDEKNNTNILLPYPKCCVGWDAVFSCGTTGKVEKVTSLTKGWFLFKLKGSFKNHKVRLMESFTSWNECSKQTHFGLPMPDEVFLIHIGLLNDWILVDKEPHLVVDILHVGETIELKVSRDVGKHFNSFNVTFKGALRTLMNKSFNGPAGCYNREIGDGFSYTWNEREPEEKSWWCFWS